MNYASQQAVSIIEKSIGYQKNIKLKSLKLESLKVQNIVIFSITKNISQKYQDMTILKKSSYFDRTWTSNFSKYSMTFNNGRPIIDDGSLPLILLTKFIAAPSILMLAAHFSTSSASR